MGARNQLERRRQRAVQQEMPLGDGPKVNMSYHAQNRPARPLEGEGEYSPIQDVAKTATSGAGEATEAEENIGWPSYRDPRPDLREDSELWNRLLRIAWDFHPQEKAKNFEFCKVLNYFRCGGTRIRRKEDGRYVLRPDIDPSGRAAWASQAEYDEMKEKFLRPWFDWLRYALKRLEKGNGENDNER